jgi:hypothetical protein
MKSIWLTTLGLMFLSASCALPLAAMVVATDRWVDISRLMTVTTLAIAAYLARYGKNDVGHWYFGFALAGWACFVLVTDSISSWNPLALRNPKTGFLPLSFLTPFMSAGQLGDSLNRGGLVAPWGNRYCILHYLFVLVVASMGGQVCWIVNRRRGRPRDDWAWPAGVWRVTSEDRDGGGTGKEVRERLPRL